ncbi:MAG: DUF3168 domain-containing protein [Sphingomonadaceae bacterium]
MRASVVLQRRVVAALHASPALSARKLRIYDGPPPDASPPYLSVGAENILDWGWKGGGGVDHRFQVQLWDASDGVGSAKAILADVEAAVLAMPRVGDGVRLVMLRRLRAQVRRRPGQWTEATVEFRALVVMENQDGD